MCMCGVGVHNYNSKYKWLTLIFCKDGSVHVGDIKKYIQIDMC